MQEPNQMTLREKMNKYFISLAEEGMAAADKEFAEAKEKKVPRARKSFNRPAVTPTTSSAATPTTSSGPSGPSTTSAPSATKRVSTCPLDAKPFSKKARMEMMDRELNLNREEDDDIQIVDEEPGESRLCPPVSDPFSASSSRAVSPKPERPPTREIFLPNRTPPPPVLKSQVPEISLPPQVTPLQISIRDGQAPSLQVQVPPDRYEPISDDEDAHPRSQPMEIDHYPSLDLAPGTTSNVPNPLSSPLCSPFPSGSTPITSTPITPFSSTYEESDPSRLPTPPMLTQRFHQDPAIALQPFRLQPPPQLNHQEMWPQRGRREGSRNNSHKAYLRDVANHFVAQRIQPFCALPHCRVAIPQCYTCRSPFSTMSMAKKHLSAVTNCSPGQGLSGADKEFLAKMELDSYAMVRELFPCPGVSLAPFHPNPHYM